MPFSPTSWPGGTGLPSGWTQNGTTGEVVAKSTTAAGVPLHVEGIAGQDPAGGWTLLQVDDANAFVRFTLESNGNFLIFPRADVGGRFQVQDELSRGVDCQAGGFFFRGLNAAPADSLLAGGDFALWLDETDGVGNTKLMVKAKSADGTVKTAAIVLA